MLWFAALAAGLLDWVFGRTFPFSLRGQQIILQERFSTNCYVRKAREPAGYEHGYLHSFLLLKRGFSTKPTMTTRMQMDLFWTDGAKK
jgi:hypothetical protein